ncbi:MAG: hypothetical protein L3J29_00665 [Cyclobacteriaceae bacterium]|nr:hypothetical protein [Cyclobacteriaceae bacterium]
MKQRFFYMVLLGVLSWSCTTPTFYQKLYDFNKKVSDGNLAEAEAMVKSNEEKLKKSKTRFLFWVNAGVVESMQGHFEESNAYFEKADLFIEDDKKKVGEEGAALLLNPNLSTYRGEDHEKLMINYYKALNYYQLGEYDEAIVECKRMNIRLQQLSDKYKSDRKYKEDAFIHTLMGIIYDGTGDYNNAFIAYRNAFNIYANSYKQLFKFKIPNQLKHDLVRTADLSGIYDERDRFAKKFEIDYVRPKPNQSQAVVLWNNGLGPIKDEWGINFAIVYTGNGWVSFVNADYGMTFPFYIGNSDLNGLTWIKVVFPKYVERPLLYKSGSITYNNETKELSKIEDLNAISFKVLEERMLLEFAKSLGRVALKQAAAAQVGKDNEGLGMALSLLASATESADTRNWQTLPHSIYYTRVFIDTHEDNDMTLNLKDANGNIVKHEFKVKSKQSETVIFPVNTMATMPWKMRGYQVSQ